MIQSGYYCAFSNDIYHVYRDKIKQNRRLHCIAHRLVVAPGKTGPDSPSSRLIRHLLTHPLDLPDLPDQGTEVIMCIYLNKRLSLFKTEGMST